MKKIDRRKFIYSTAIMACIPAVVSSFGNETIRKSEATSNNILVGTITSANNPEENLKRVSEQGFKACQLGFGTYSPELAVRVAASLEKYKLRAASLTCMGPGKYVWNLIDGPSTIGIVPRENRAIRVERLKQAIDFCKEAHIPAVHSHFGFIPEDPKNILYIEFIETLKDLGEYALKKGIDIHFETGQETPVTLLRTIVDTGTGNLWVNYDTANLVMYGKANPLDGLKVIGKYVRALHAKDGTYPVNPVDLGKEVPIPTGEVNFPAVISYLKKLGFNGSIIIEYEMSGRSKDYLSNTKKYLEKLISNN